MTCSRATARLLVEPRCRTVLAGTTFHSPLSLRRRPFFWLFHALSSLSLLLPLSVLQSLSSARGRARERTARWYTKGERKRKNSEAAEREEIGEEGKKSLVFFLFSTSFSPKTSFFSLSLPPRQTTSRPPPPRRSRMPSRPSRTPSRTSKTPSSTPSRRPLQKNPRLHPSRSRSGPPRTTRASRRPTSRGTATRATTSTTDAWRRRARRTRSASS